MRKMMGVLLLTAISGLVGCGTRSGIEGTIGASGTVTYQGQPVEGATVVFSPEGPGRAASGLTDANGRFELTTLMASDGVLAGKYQVAVSKTETVGAMSEEESLAYAEKHGKPPKVTTRELLPEKYKNLATSNLTAEVTADGENDFTFSLTD
ncbi:MAG: carboxypeptidase regulatory-like domain-containing protein [Candidatus Anammoximicrobium sp.]|nr:carboxypeptidase regulatory-like domain-containing protein [Candidatus Anammoximicrobium sp.]